MWVSELFLRQVVPTVFFRPRYCFRYLAIRMKYYFNIICQCFSVLPFPATTNNKPKAQPNRKCSWYSSKVKILGSQPDVISLIWIDHMFIVPIFNWDLAHILQPRLSSPHIYPSTALSFLAIEELDENSHTNSKTNYSVYFIWSMRYRYIGRILRTWVQCIP